MLDTLSLAFSIAIAAPHRAARDVSVTERFVLPSAPSLSRNVVAERMFGKLNEIRAAAGVAPLALDPELSRIALEHARDMIARRYFGHVAPDGESPKDRLNRHAYAYTITGENIAFCANEHEAEVALWRSTDHRHNELDTRFRRTGVAVLRVGSYGAIFVQIYTD